MPIYMPASMSCGTNLLGFKQINRVSQPPEVVMSIGKYQPRYARYHLSASILQLIDLGSIFLVLQQILQTRLVLLE